MKDELKSKVAIVTGATRGIGRATALAVAREGADVAFTYLKSTDRAESLCKEIQGYKRRSLAMQVDVRDFQKSKEMVRQVLEKLGRLDILINNAGVTKDKALMMMTEDDWRQVIDTNLNGTFNVTRNCIVTFLKQKQGNIINVSSVSGIAGMARQTNYAASKAGIIGFTKSLAKEVAAHNIRVNAIAPGFIETDMLSELKDEQRGEIKKMVPLGRIGRSEDVTGAVKFLLSENSGFITGQTIVIDGGLFIR